MHIQEGQQMYEQDQMQVYEQELPDEFTEQDSQDCISRDNSQPFQLDESKIHPPRPKVSLASSEFLKGRRQDSEFNQPDNFNMFSNQYDQRRSEPVLQMHKPQQHQQQQQQQQLLQQSQNQFQPVSILVTNNDNLQIKRINERCQ